MNPNPKGRGITPADVDAAAAVLAPLARSARRDIINPALEQELAAMNLDPDELAVMRRGLGLAED